MSQAFICEGISYLKTGITVYAGTKAVETYAGINESLKHREFELKSGSALWKSSISTERLQGFENSYELALVYSLEKGFEKNCACFLELEVGQWSQENYVLMPGAAYNGNRFRSIKTGYPPLITNISEMGADFETTITDVPRLAVNDENSAISLLSGDMSTPAVGFYDFYNKRGFLLVTEQMTCFGEMGISLTELPGEGKAVIRVSSPGIREETRYSMCSMDTAKSDDRGADLTCGDAMQLKIRLHSFKCEDIQGLFDFFLLTRKALSGDGVLENLIPFSKAWSIQERVYNEERWDSDGHYYYSFPKDPVINMMDYQLGWVGGLMCTHALILEGNSLSRQRAVENLETVFSKTQAPSGFFYGSGNGGSFFCDGIWEAQWPHNMHSVRKSGDGLFYMLKQCMALEKTDSCWKTPEHWRQGIRRLADSFAELWKRYGQLGQVVDIETGNLLIGGSTAGAIVPAGLALAAEYFKNNEYLQIAMECAEYYYRKYTCAGITTGGPIEILQCPDSESAYALVESYTVIYEATLDKKWIKVASDATAQFASWCVSYDYKWPEGAEFGRLGMKTTGTVIANVQNKHSAPGICTMSGDALFKLYRATGNNIYIELLQEIAHNLTQYLSREDRPINSWDGRKLPPGWMCERVNMSDWEGKDRIGGVFYCHCWCEVSNMLTWAEVPGVYVQTDTGFICTIDHVEAEIMEKEPGCVKVQIHNPTKFDAEVKIFAEKSSDLGIPLLQNWLYGCQRVAVRAGETVEITLE